MPVAADMSILYCAIDQTVPGTKGGSVHVTAVAEGLAALGHEVHVLATPGDGPFPAGAVRWIAMPPPLGAQGAALVRSRRGRAASPTALRPTSSSSGTTTSAARGSSPPRAAGATAVLEVNAPVIDYPGSTKALLDRALLVEPMRRWRERLCARADLIVTPSAAILPPATPTERSSSSSGAPTRIGFIPAPAARCRSRARPARWRSSPARSAAGTAPCTWSRAIRELRARGRTRHRRGVHRRRPGAAARACRRPRGSTGVVFTGAVPHAAMPACLAAATSASRRSTSARTGRSRSASTGRR